MASNRKYKCPFCKVHDIKEKLIYHIDKKHEDMIPEGFTAARVLFHYLHKKPYNEKGKCVICKGETDWNEKTYKYNRLCNRRECKEKLRENYKKNMLRVFGTYNILNDMNQQEKMLKNRSISGIYKFRNGKIKDYVGSYEKKFLEFCDIMLGFDPDDIMMPGPTIEYNYKGEKHQWITDALIVPYNLVIDIKDGGSNPNNREMSSYREKQIEKEKVITDKGEYNYLRLTDNQFPQLIGIIYELKLQMLDDPNTTKTISRVHESIEEEKEIMNAMSKEDRYWVEGTRKNTVFHYIHHLDNKPVGFIDLLKDNNYENAVYIEYGVHPDYRGKGLARTLMQKAFNWAQHEIVPEPTVIYYVDKRNKNSIEVIERLKDAFDMHKFGEEYGKIIYFSDPTGAPLRPIKRKSIKESDELIDYKSYSQQSDYTCGPSAAYTVMKWFLGESPDSESSIANIMSTNSMDGTSVENMSKYFKQKGWIVKNSLTDKTPNTYEEFISFIESYLKHNIPIMVENKDHNESHWRVIIGLNNSIIKFADSYDKYDDNEDGFSSMPANKFFDNWYDDTMLSPKIKIKEWVIAYPSNIIKESSDVEMDIKDLSSAKEQEYYKYLKIHEVRLKASFNDRIYALKNALLLSKEQCEELKERILKHDASRYTPEEWDNWRKSYFPINDKEKEEGEKTEKEARKHHYKVNAHHPEHWNGKEMDKVSIAEMIIDWEADSKADGGNPLKWWLYNDEAKEKKKLLNPKTREEVERVLQTIYDVNMNLKDNFDRIDDPKKAD